MPKRKSPTEKTLEKIERQLERATKPNVPYTTIYWQNQRKIQPLSLRQRVKRAMDEFERIMNTEL